MSWGSLWAKAWENHARSRRAAGYGRVFVIGAIFAGAGGTMLYSDVTHQIHGERTTATLMAHLKKCTVEYQKIGEQERKEQWPCELAEEFQRRIGANKVKLSRDGVARVEYRLADGRTQQAEVDDFKFGTSGLAIGTTVPAVYAVGNPTDVRPKMSWHTLKVPLILLAIGLPFLALLFYSLFGASLTSLFRGRREEPLSDSSDHLPTSAQMSEWTDNSPIQRSRAAQAAYLSRAGAAPRTSFGTRNR